MLSFGVLILILLIMAYQDIKSRSITVFLFLVLACLLMVTSLQHRSWPQVVTAVAINVIFVVLHVLAVVLYLSFKHKTLVNPFVHHLGVGDLLFWIAVSPAFSPLNYIVSFLLSVAFALCASVVVRYKQRDSTVPLAGLQAVFYALFFAANTLFLHFDCHDDSLFLYALV